MRRDGTALRIRVAMWLAILCLISGGVMACSATPATAGVTQGLYLHVVRTGPFAAGSSLDTYVYDSAAVQRLYAAALKLPQPHGTIFNCPPDNGVEYHLTFVGGTVTQRHMDLEASGCRFLAIGQQGYYTTNAFIALFMRTVGITVLDPSFGY